MRRIAIEGIDGSGKTSLVKAVSDSIGVWPAPIKTIAQPTSGVVGQLIRRLLSGLDEPEGDMEKWIFFMYVADALSVEKHVSLLIRDGWYAVFDRHTWISAFVYQRDSFTEFDIARVLEASGIQRPNITFIVDVPAHVAAARCASRPKYVDVLFDETVDRLEVYRHRYLDIANTRHPANPTDCTMILDGERPIDDNAQAIVDKLREDYRASL